MNAQDTLNSAKRHQAAGALAEAEKIYRQCLREQPNDPEVLYLLGALISQRGETDAAIDLIRRSISFAPDHAQTHRNLGLLLAKQGRLDEALDCFSQAARLDPDDPLAHRNLAKVLAIRNKLDDALSAYRRAVELKPDFAEAHLEFAYILALQARFEEAIRAFSKAIQIKPDFATAYLGLGHVYRAMGLFKEALASFRQAIRFNPDLAEAHAGMAMIFATVHKFDEAMASHARAAQLKPDSAIAQEVMGWIFLNRNDGTNAIDYFRRALAIDPNMISVWNSLGQALLFQGQFDEAAECFRHMLAIRPDSAVAHKYLLQASRTKGDGQIEPLLHLVRLHNLSNDDRIVAEFALATAFDDTERYDEAFEHAARGNELAKTQRAQFGRRYDAAAFHSRVERLIELFTPEFFEQRRQWGDPSGLPVFVVGMPRSGTTLAQQIAGSHRQVYCAGELNNIFNLSDRLIETDAPRWISDSIEKAAGLHLAFLRGLNSDASRIIDKMPSNLHSLGLIAVLFPQARVIFCRRDARDTCLSCFFHLFPNGNTFSYDLADCGHYYRENDRLAAHWLRVLPLRMLELRYEDVVADLEGQSRRLIDFLDLPWDPTCLEFHRAKNTVLTSSVWQVRQPIYERSVGRWRHYQKHLGPLFKALEE